MEKHSVGVVVLMMILISTMAIDELEATPKYDHVHEKVTNLQFYLHDFVSGKTPTAVRVAQAADTEKSPTLFGALNMADDPLTETPDPKSKLVGRAQGLYGSAGQQELGLIMAMTFAFTEGEYNGSSISILGRNAILNPVREMAVVGGTGIFRLARGYAIGKAHWVNAATGTMSRWFTITNKKY